MPQSFDDVYPLAQANRESNRETREALIQGLLLLMGEKPFEQIRITDLIKRSGVARSSFYRNYSSKDEVLEDFYRVLRGKFDSLAAESLTDSWVAVFDIIREYAQEIRALITTGKSEIILHQLNENAMDDLALLWNGMIYNLILTWATTDLEESSEELAERQIQALNNIARRLELEASQ